MSFSHAQGGARMAGRPLLPRAAGGKPAESAAEAQCAAAAARFPGPGAQSGLVGSAAGRSNYYEKGWPTRIRMFAVSSWATITFVRGSYVAGCIRVYHGECRVCLRIFGFKCGLSNEGGDAAVSANESLLAFLSRRIIVSALI